MFQDSGTAIQKAFITLTILVLSIQGLGKGITLIIITGNKTQGTTLYLLLLNKGGNRYER